MTYLKLSTRRACLSSALAPALVALGLVAGACANTSPLPPSGASGVQVDNVQVSPTDTHVGGVLSLSFDLNAVGTTIDEYTLSVVLRSADIDAEVTVIEVEGIGGTEETPPTEVGGVRFDRQVVTFEADTNNRKAEVLREFQIPPDAPPGTYEIVLQDDSGETVLPEQLTLVEPTEPDLIITSVSLSNNSFELLGDEADPIDPELPAPLTVNLEVANTGANVPEGTAVEIYAELTCDDVTLVLPISLGGSGQDEALVLAETFPRNAVEGVSASLYFPAEAYAAWATLTEEATCELSAVITPGSTVATMPIQFLPGGEIGDGLQNSRAATPWITAYDLATTLGGSAAGVIGPDGSLLKFNTSYTTLPNHLKYKLATIAGIPNIPLGVDFQSHFNVTLNVGLLGFNGAFVLTDVEALLTVDAEELLGFGDEECDPTRPAIRLNATAFDEDVFPPYEVMNPCPPKVDIPTVITISKSFSLFNKEFDRTLFAVTVPVGPVPVFSNMGAKGHAGLGGNVQLALFPLDMKLVLTATGGPDGELGGFVEGGVGVPVLGIGIRSELSLIQAEMSVRPSLSVDLLNDPSAKLDITVPLTISSLDGAVKFVVNLVLFSYDYTFLNWQGFSDKWMLYESSGVLKAGDILDLPPKGPYTELCEFRGFDGHTLRAVCRATPDGALHPESSAFECPVYTSSGGVLQCGSPPAGTWQQEGCTLVAWDGEVLTATCRANSGALVKSALPGCGTYRKATDGSGRLACLPAPGSWKNSCTTLSYNGTRLKARCRAGNGDQHVTTVSGCKGYHNIQGHLTCDAPPGNWAALCRPHWWSYDATSDTLTAECDNSGIILSGSYQVSWSGCGAAGFTMGDPINGHRRLTCPLPGGSWRGAGSWMQFATAQYDGDTLCVDTMSGVDRGVFSNSNRYKRTCASHCVGDWAIATSDLPTDPPGPTAHVSCNWNSIAPGGFSNGVCRDAYGSDGQLCGICEPAGSPQLPELDTCSPKNRNCRLRFHYQHNAGEQWQGVLLCEGENLPPGSWARTCRATQWDGQKRKLCGYCMNPQGRWPVDARNQLINRCAKGCRSFKNGGGTFACE
jgi:hypothetical protein